MLIINADDWGRSREETDLALRCFREGRVTSVSAMVFMEDSERAAGVALENGLDTGLHLNLSQHYNGEGIGSRAALESHKRVIRFIGLRQVGMLLYHPGLRTAFREVFQSQLDEFIRLYGKAPSHIDGHQHRHLCANMLLDRIIPEGTKIRRNFTFMPGEKSWMNRLFRSLMDRWLACRYILTDYFFSLTDCLRAGRIRYVRDLALAANVEVMTHPVYPEEYRFLMDEASRNLMDGVAMGGYACLGGRQTVAGR